jgi:hypothetical protein
MNLHSKASPIVVSYRLENFLVDIARLERSEFSGTKEMTASADQEQNV